MEASWGSLGRSWRRFGSDLGRYEGHVETELAKISPTLAKITEIFKNKGKSWFFGPVERVLGRPGGVWRLLGGVMDGLGGILGASWALLEAS